MSQLEINPDGPIDGILHFTDKNFHFVSHPGSNNRIHIHVDSDNDRMEIEIFSDKNEYEDEPEVLNLSFDEWSDVLIELAKSRS